jgi:hypothetical protein
MAVSVRKQAEKELKRLGGNDSPYVPKSRLFWGRFGSRYVEATYDTNDMMLIF